MVRKLASQCRTRCVFCTVRALNRTSELCTNPHHYHTFVIFKPIFHPTSVVSLLYFQSLSVTVPSAGHLSHTRLAPPDQIRSCTRFIFKKAEQILVWKAVSTISHFLSRGSLSSFSLPSFLLSFARSDSLKLLASDSWLKDLPSLFHLICSRLPWQRSLKYLVFNYT